MSKYGNTGVQDEEIRESQKGVANGVAELDAGGQVPASQLGNAVTVETDPVFTASQAANITAGDITNLGNLSGVNSGDEVQATEGVAGIAEVATQAETDAGTDDTRFVTPAKLANYPFPSGGVYGQERFYVESLALSTTSSAALVDKINTNTPALNPAHTYEVHWSCETNADLNYRRVQVEVVIGGVTVSDASSETETQPDFQDRSGFLGSITGLSGAQALTMRYSRNGGPGTVTVGIRQAKISLIRVA